VIRLKPGIIGLVLFFLLMNACPVVAKSEKAWNYQGRFSNQMHVNAFSFSILGQGWRRVHSASIGGKYHFSYDRAVQVTLGFERSRKWGSINYPSGEEYKKNSYGTGFEVGAQYLLFFSPEYTLSPFIGFGPGFGMHFFALDDELIHAGFSRVRDYHIYYRYSLNAIFGFEWVMSKKTSFVAGYAAGVSYRRSNIKNSSSTSVLKETAFKDFYIDYEVVSLGIAYYIK